MPDVQEQLEVLQAGTAHCISPEELEHKLELGRPLRVKLGIDPTASDIHLGFAVVLRKLRQFQDFGHRAVLILGDFTAQVGDPSGRSKTRPRLSSQEVQANVASYLDQIRKVLRFDGDLVEIRRNSDWLAIMDMEQVLRLTARITVAQLLERDDFAKRHRTGSAISMMELLYPLLQGYDSVIVEADVELGGTDQLFNNLVGRELQRAEGQDPQVVLTTPLLEGLDGVEKMSKSLGNYVGITDPPAEMFGKLMKIPDPLMPKYFALTTGWRPDRLREVTESFENGGLRPVDAKRLLARTVVGLYHGNAEAHRAEAEFDRVFKAGQAPKEVPEVELLLWPGTVPILQILVDTGLVPSNNEGRRMIKQRAVRLGGVLVEEPDWPVTADDVDGREIQVGKRKWARVRVR